MCVFNCSDLLYLEVAASRHMVILSLSPCQEPTGFWSCVISVSNSVLMLITILQCICSNVPKNLRIIFPYPPPPNTPPLATAPYCFHSAAGQRSRLRSKHHFLITVNQNTSVICLEDEAVLLFDSYFTFESKLR